MTTMYQDLEVYLQGPPHDGGYGVSVWARQLDLRAQGSLRLPYSPEVLARALRWMEQGLFDEAYVVEFGSSLFKALFEGEIKRLYDVVVASASLVRFRVVADPSAAALATVPWELLYDPERHVALAAAYPFVRGLALTDPTHALPVGPPLRILVVDSFPRGVLRVQDQLESAGIKHALNGLVRRRRVVVETLSDATVSRLQNALREGIDPEHPRPVHVIHFIGHGSSDPATGRTVLLFSDERGEVDEVTPDVFANLVRGYDIKLVFLNACQSLQVSALDLAQGFAPALLRSGIPAVIGMQATVLDELAVRFSQDFYAGLADNRPVDLALTDARRLARGTHLRHKADLGIPVCYLRAESGQIMELKPRTSVPLTRATLRPWLRENATPRRMIASFLSVITLVATLIGLYTGGESILASLRPAPIPHIGGDLAIAVVPFTEVDAAGNLLDQAQGDEIADEVAGKLDRELKRLADQAVRNGEPDYDLRVAGFGTKKVRPLVGRTPEERHADARQLAFDYGAAVVIYGDLTNSPGASSLQPVLYVSGESLRDAEELAGEHDLEPLRVADNIAQNPRASAQLRDDAAATVPATAQFLMGLGNYRLGEIQLAETYFEAALDQQGSTADIERVYALFAGKAAHDLHQWDKAQGYYAQALEKSGEFARAQLGFADTIFQNAKGDCNVQDVDHQGLRRAISEYEKARAARDQISEANIGIKLSFYLGRAYMCLSLAGVEDRWAEAERETRAVIEAYRAADEAEKLRSGGRASDAYANLALIQWAGPAHDLSAARETVQRALDANAEDAKNGRRLDRQAVLYYLLAQLDEQLGDYAGADQAWPEAIGLDETNPVVTRTPSPYREKRNEALNSRLQPPPLAAPAP